MKLLQASEMTASEYILAWKNRPNETLQDQGKSSIPFIYICLVYLKKPNMPSIFIKLAAISAHHIAEYSNDTIKNTFQGDA